MRLKRSKLYGQAGLALTLPAGATTATVVPGSAVTTSTVVFNDTKLSRHESLAQKLGSVSMANLGKEDQVRDKARFISFSNDSSIAFQNVRFSLFHYC